MDDAIDHAARGASAWEWASNTDGGEPDVVLACAGDTPTLETVAAAWLLRRLAPELRVRVVNVLDLMTLFSPSIHPHGMPDESVRRAIHGRQARGVRLSRLSVRRSPTRSPPPAPCALPRPRVQRARHDDDAVRHGDPERNESVSSRRAGDPLRADRLRSRGRELTATLRRLDRGSRPLLARAFEDAPEIRDWQWTDS